MLFVNKKKAFRWFRRHFDMKPTSQNWWAFDNPFDLSGAGKRKMAVQFEYEMVKCWRTGYRERLLTFVSDYLNVSLKEARAIIADEDEAQIEDDTLSVKNIGPAQRFGMELPYGYTGLFDDDSMLSKRARTYLSNRGFDLEELDAMGFGYCAKAHKEKEKDFFGYIIIPFIRAGMLEYFIGRDFTNNFLRYKNPDKVTFGVGKEEVLFNANALHLYDEVLLFEGWSDAVITGKNCISTQGWTFSEKQLDIIARSPVKRITVVADRGYFKQAVKSAMRLLDVVEEVYATNLDPYCQGDEKDANDIGRERTLKAVHEGSIKITMLSGINLMTEL